MAFFTAFLVSVQLCLSILANAELPTAENLVQQLEFNTANKKFTYLRYMTYIIHIFTECRSGHQIDSNSQCCDPCIPGMYSAAGEVCRPCEVGFFNNMFGASQCSPCPIGSYSNSSGSIYCKQCKAGSYNFNIGQSSCSDFPLGTFTPVSGLDSCINCPPGTYGDTTSATKWIPCPSGTYNSLVGSKSSKYCFDCPNNTASLPGSPICCPIGKYLMEGIYPSCEDCIEDYYADPLNYNTCKKCPYGTSRAPYESICTEREIRN